MWRQRAVGLVLAALLAAGVASLFIDGGHLVQRLGADLAGVPRLLHTQGVRTLGNDCLKRADRLHASAPPSPTPTVAADLNSDVVALDRVPPLGGAPADEGEVIAAIHTWAAGHDDVYAGEFIANGHVYVAISRDPAAHLAEVRRRLPHPEELRAVAARYNLTQLHGVTSRIDADRDSFAKVGVHWTSYAVDEVHNMVDISVSDTDPRVADELRARYGADIVRVNLGVLVCLTN